jgi:hypothetical protein
MTEFSEKHPKTVRAGGSYVSQLEQARGYALLLIHSFDDTNRPAFYFLKTPATKARHVLWEIEQKAANGGVDLESYGEIIYAGYGAAAPQALCNAVAERFLQHSLD